LRHFSSEGKSGTETMLFERRAYTLRPGCEETFWQLQRKWNTPKTYRPMLERNLGYFAMSAGPAERIIHLYRWDDYEDGKRRIAAIATLERAEYFASARNLMLAQETILLDRAPIAELNPLWSGDRDWLPGDPPFGGAEDASTLAISESVLDFLPGGLAAYWDGYRKLDARTMELVRAGLIGVFFVTTGPLHRAIHYHWHRRWLEAEDRRRALAESAAWQAFAESYKPRVIGSHVSYLRPSPVPLMRSLFDFIDWSVS
jgi:hypothetical protein